MIKQKLNFILKSPLIQQTALMVNLPNRYSNNQNQI